MRRQGTVWEKSFGLYHVSEKVKLCIVGALLKNADDLRNQQLLVFSFHVRCFCFEYMINYCLLCSVFSIMCYGTRSDSTASSRVICCEDLNLKETILQSSVWTVNDRCTFFVSSSVLLCLRCLFRFKIEYQFGEWISKIWGTRVLCVISHLFY